MKTHQSVFKSRIISSEQVRFFESYVETFLNPPRVALILAFSLLLSMQALALPSAVHFQGEILDASENPLNSSSVVFTLQIANPGGSCVLYEETQTLNMTNSGGVFDLALGTGTLTTGSSSQNATPPVSFNAAFSNAAALNGLKCGSYTPAASDGRQLNVRFNDGSQTVTLSTPYAITSVPYAMYAGNSDTLQGLTSSQFIKTNSSTAAVTQANLEEVFASTSNVNQLMSIINGTATGTSTSMSAGSAVSPSYTFNGDTTSGLYDVSPGQIGISVSGAQSAYFTSTGVNIPLTSASMNASTGALVVGGGLGVGGALNVASSIRSLGGSLTSEGASASPYANSSSSLSSPIGPNILARNISSNDLSGAFTNFAVLNSSSLSQTAYIGAIATNGGGYTPSIVIGQQTGINSYSERFRIDQNGNVGIGTASPAGTLDVEGGNAAFGIAGTNINLTAQSTQSGMGVGAGGISLSAGTLTSGGSGGASLLMTGGQPSWQGGALTLSGGTAGAAGPMGGAVIVAGGSSAQAGAVTVTGGTAPLGSGIGGGTVNIIGGHAETYFLGGDVNVIGGLADNNTSGNVYIAPGVKTGGNGAGNVLLGIDSAGLGRGNVGVGTTSPQATLDVNGYARLKSYNSAPIICNPTYAGSIALNSNYTGCTCNGSSWIKLSDATACIW